MYGIETSFLLMHITERTDVKKGDMSFGGIMYSYTNPFGNEHGHVLIILIRRSRQNLR